MTPHLFQRFSTPLPPHITFIYINLHPFIYIHEANWHKMTVKGFWFGYFYSTKVICDNTMSFMDWTSYIVLFLLKFFLFFSLPISFSYRKLFVPVFQFVLWRCHHIIASYKLYESREKQTKKTFSNRHFLGLIL